LIATGLLRYRIATQVKCQLTVADQLDDGNVNFDKGFSFTAVTGKQRRLAPGRPCRCTLVAQPRDPFGARLIPQESAQRYALGFGLRFAW
jgi:hypothetical protein